MGKHTPGPWTADPGAVTGAPHTYVRTGGRREARAVARAQGRSARESEANARLIAAAPDLLETLKTVERCLSESAGGGEIQQSRAGVRELARRAIRKAEGE
jgi:hypothetical protein